MRATMNMKANANGMLALAALVIFSIMAACVPQLRNSTMVNDYMVNDIMVNRDRSSINHKRLGGDPQQQQSHRRTTLRSVTPEMAVLANVGDQQVLHDLFLDLDFVEANSSLAALSQYQQATNPYGNMIVKAEGLGPLFPMVRRDALGLGLMAVSRLMRPVWQGKWLEFPSPDPYLATAALGNTTTNVLGKFINQYVGLQGWTGHLYTGTLKQATANERPPARAEIAELSSLVPTHPMVTLDDKPSLLMDYRRGQNLGTNFVDECRPLDEEKLVAAGILDTSDTTMDSQWDYVWLCRGTAPRFLQLGGARVFVMFFMVQIMPDTISYNVTT